jgi:hypothetical protein
VAKTQKKPVYYVLDGIDINDVADYKKFKNKAIEDFIAGGGQQKSAPKHGEVVTMVEVREILKNWDDLKFERDGEVKDTVRFVQKGNILKGEDLKNFLAEWQDKMKTSNEQAGRALAPPREEFANELKAIDPRLMAKLQAGPEGDKDARDIARKSRYFVNIAKAQPQILLKYLMSKCDVLMREGFDLISKELPTVALQFRDAKGDKIEQAKAKLLAEIEKCNAKFREPLRTALLGLQPQLAAQGEQH